MTVINHKSISGVTSITAPAGSDDLLTVHTNDTSERFRILKSGAIVTGVATASNFKTGTSNLHNVGVEVAGINVLGADTPIGTGATIYDAGGAVFTGVVTATSFVGGLPISNESNDRVLTSSGSGAINAEANLTMTGNVLTFNTTANSHRIQNVATGNHYTTLEFNSNRSSAADILSIIDFKWDGDKVADILALAGADTSNKDDGHLVFRTSPSQGSIAERLRITSDGKIGINEDVPQSTLHVASTSNYVDIGLSNSTSGHTGSDGANIFYNNNLELALWNRESTGIIRFATDGTERARIDASGHTTFKRSFNLTSSSDNHHLYEGRSWTWTSNGLSSGTVRAYMYGDSSSNLRIGTNGWNERLRITSNGYFGVGETPTTKVGVALAAQQADGTDDASDWGAGGIFQLDATGSAANGNEILLLGAHSGGVGQIASGLGFGRENTSNWGTYLSFKTHSTGTSNIDELNERLRITSTGLFGFNNTTPGGACIDATHSRTNAYGATSDHRGLAQIVARNASDAAGRFASISLVSGGGTQAEASINLVQTGNYQGDLTFKSRTAVSAWTEKMRISSTGRLLLGTTDNSGYGNRSAYFHKTDGDGWNYLSITGATSGGAGIVFGDSTAQNGGNYESYMYHNNGDNNFNILTDRGNKTFRFYNDGDFAVLNGKLGVGVDPTEQLHVLKSHNGHTRAVIQNNWGANATAQLKLVAPTDELQLIKYASGAAAINLSNNSTIYASIGGTERLKIRGDSTGQTTHIVNTPSPGGNGVQSQYVTQPYGMSGNYTNFRVTVTASSWHSFFLKFYVSGYSGDAAYRWVTGYCNNGFGTIRHVHSYDGGDFGSGTLTHISGQSWRYDLSVNSNSVTHPVMHVELSVAGNGNVLGNGAVVCAIT